ncbi:glutamate 5-kinase [Coralloluteibacterium stylophorae]|uniref:Glutamate 5-kinase n=1 Tax=Coralloluteibacterium stylophorae TaxID=1776034 RepID=A0A8J7VTW2_9GAMM|nr:glutamate 5-kinase [Coralloluteibacterium stylophorae]MBS7455686.1 glutamate 5-kinase [Coralloluteibacterium stylophorae]
MSRALAAFPAQALPAWRRGVLKVGSSLLAADGGGLSPRHALGLAQFVAAQRAAGREMVIVSSGAVAAGRALLPGPRSGGAPLAARQALAALGQARLVELWQRFFEVPVAQVLLTHDDLRNRRRYLNARATLLELLRMGALPVVNENDTVCVDELKLGDNDNLAAIVAALVDADLLFIASDIAGLYSADPRLDPAAVPVPLLAAIDGATLAMAGAAGSAVGTGGMRTKLEAAQRARGAGIGTLLFDGTDPAVLRELAQGRLHGTRVASPGNRRTARKHWLASVPAQGRLRIDAGAAAALVGRGASLLPGGLVAVEGEFGRGEAVDILAVGDDRPLARGLAQYGADDARRIAGAHSSAIAGLLGYSYGGNLVHRDDLVLVAERPFPPPQG